MLEYSHFDSEVLFAIRPADVPGFSLGGRPAPLHAGRLNAEDKHLPEVIGCPVVFLTSGQKLTLHKVMLYDEDGVQEVAKLRAQAAKSLGGGSRGVGVIGLPGWTLLGEAAAISIIGGLLSNVAQKQAVEMLQTAQRKSEAVAKSGVFFDFAQVTNSQSPHPSVWCATVEFTHRNRMQLSTEAGYNSLKARCRSLQSRCGTDTSTTVMSL